MAIALKLNKPPSQGLDSSKLVSIIFKDTYSTNYEIALTNSLSEDVRLKAYQVKHEFGSFVLNVTSRKMNRRSFCTKINFIKKADERKVLVG